MVQNASENMGKTLRQGILEKIESLTKVVNEGRQFFLCNLRGVLAENLVEFLVNVPLFRLGVMSSHFGIALLQLIDVESVTVPLGRLSLDP